MSDPKPDVEQQLRQALSEILIARARLFKILQERQGTGWPGCSTLEAACTKLERLATEMQWAVESGLAKDLADSDPGVLRRIEETQRHFINVSIQKLEAVIGELRGEEEPEPGHVN